MSKENEQIIQMAKAIKDSLDQLKDLPITNVEEVEQMASHLVELKAMRSQAMMVRGFLVSSNLIELLDDVISDIDAHCTTETEKIVNFTNSL